MAGEKGLIVVGHLRDSSLERGLTRGSHICGWKEVAVLPVSQERGYFVISVDNSLAFVCVQTWS